MRFESLDNHAVDVMLGYQVQQWQQALSEGKRLRLDGLGTLAKTGLQWVFQPAMRPISCQKLMAFPFSAPPHLPTLWCYPDGRNCHQNAFMDCAFACSSSCNGSSDLLALGASKADFRDMVQSASLTPPRNGVHSGPPQATGWMTSSLKEASTSEVAVDEPVVIERDIILSDVEMEPSKEGPRSF